MNLEAKVTSLDPAIMHDDERPGELSRFGCPECTGPLYQIQDGQLVRFRCGVGHAYTADSMLDEKDEALEAALYLTAVIGTEVSRRTSPIRTGASVCETAFFEQAFGDGKNEGRRSGVVGGKGERRPGNRGKQ